LAGQRAPAAQQYRAAEAPTAWSMLQASRSPWHGNPLWSAKRTFAKSDCEHLKSKRVPEDEREQHEHVTKWAERMVAGRPFFETNQKYRDLDVYNASISRCFNCDEICVWIHDELFWPRLPHGPLPNVDLAKDARRDYEEASNILDISPRGAAALLRLAIQKLCKELGERGDNINDDIAALVKKGLDPRVQRALDIVRVVGNNAVHPGQIDLRDDRPTAERLFSLVNLICEKMISEPKHVDAMYEDIPENLRKAIEKRDAEKAKRPDGSSSP
jgi:hypothetical protein